MPLLGEAAALGTAVMWAGISLLFTEASRRAGSLAVNVVRISLAALILFALVRLTQPANWHHALTPFRLGCLAASGWVGLTLGDWALFTAYASIGPRIATVVMALAPPMAALLAIPLLGETLSPTGVLGMAVTLAGVAWVVLERPSTPMPRGHRIRGALFAWIGSLGQAVGLVLSKLGMGGEVNPLPATFVRMVAAMLGAWVVIALGRQWRLPGRVLGNRRTLFLTLGATLGGPVIGVWLSLVAVANTKTGIAATLMAPVPVFVLPLLVVFRHERISPRAVVGAVVAVAGVVILVLR